MALFGFLHDHQPHRQRQLRWVLPVGAGLLVAVVLALAVQYRMGDQAVGTEFFRAHKTISHTGQLLQRGFLLGLGLSVLLVLGVTAWTLRVTHRIVRPVHTLHRALDQLATGDLGVRVELHCEDEFREVADALNRLVESFGTTLATIHARTDHIEKIVSAARATTPSPEEAELHALVEDLDRTLDFFRLGPRRVIREDDGS
ncbi:MAG TPA: HAMP domain-containing protein [Candidatus Nitrosopolaris sp.]|nr:HAMP domain-containing protein [Candidatus Nitrosopolaris sp.]